MLRINTKSKIYKKNWTNNSNKVRGLEAGLQLTPVSIERKGSESRGIY